MKLDKVSIIIPCYNQAHFLPDAINSALAQSYNNKEIIVIDDGSEDNTSMVARQFNVQLIEQENRGLAGARNSGIKAASGEWILPLDADDKLHPKFIEHTINKNDIVSTNLVMFGKENRLRKSRLPHPGYEDLLKYNYLNCCALFKKEIWTTVGGYDEEMRDGYEDWDFWIRATKAGYCVTVVNENLFYYRRHGSSLYEHAVKNEAGIIAYMKGKYPVKW